MKPVVLFGDGLVASLAHFYLTHDSSHTVAAFTVDRDHLSAPEKHGLPVVPVEDVVDLYSPADYDMFVTVGYGRMNRFREEKYRQAKHMGYSLISYVSSRAVTWPDLTIGDNCFIMESNVIQPFAKLGSNIIMWSGSHVGHDSVIEDHVFVSSHVVIAGYVTIEPNCFLGINATIRDEIRVARETLVGAGAIITKNTQEKGVYVPAKSELLQISSDRLPKI
jgi:sugar O-acyltransferase (sialic acid O-acetyltransferase NeuD family)